MTMGRLSPCGFRFCAAATRMAIACDDMPVKVVAKVAGCSINAMYQRAEKLGGVWQVRRAEKCIPLAKMREAWGRTDLSLTEAGALVGLSGRTLYKHAKAMGLPPRQSGVRKIDVPDSFESMWRAGVPAATMARKFGISDSLVFLTAHRMDLPRRSRSETKTTLAEWAEMELAAKMRATAAAEQRQMIFAEMADWSSAHHLVGREKGMAA